ncbi:hypothetical protein FACS1894191_7590 [Clostridia bacterium]|nr:hypothetical protein FACS1894191_7590 [Clostridia bacterium]
MQEQANYTTDTMFFSFGDRTVRINSHTPILPQEERERRKREAEQRLFDVFSKYADMQN